MIPSALITGITKASDIGIATPYGGQVHLYNETFAKIRQDHPDLDLQSQDIAIGTSEWWQGRQASYMIADFVRATNDHGELGFMADRRRLNVLLSRQLQALVIIGDKDCTNLLSTDTRDTRNNKSRICDIIRVFTWLQEKGRVVEIPFDELSQKFVTLARPESDTDTSAVTGDGWGSTDNYWALIVLLLVDSGNTGRKTVVSI